MFDRRRYNPVVSCCYCGEEPEHDLHDSVLTRIECKTHWCRNSGNVISGSEAQSRFDEELAWFREELEKGLPNLVLPVVEPGKPYTVFDPFQGKPDWDYFIRFEEEPISFLQ